MIKNERQLGITRKWLREFKQAHVDLLSNKENVDPIMLQAEVGGVLSQIKTFRKEISDYKRLKARHTTRVKSVYDIGEMLVKARIMLGMTQKQLADKINLKEQQIQRYEDTNYAKASLSTITGIAYELGVTSGSIWISIQKEPQQ